MASSMVVPVVDVQSNNFKELWPAMLLAIKSSSFISLDTELSGLGNRKSLLAESIEDRYKAICHAARTRSVLSLGLACFKKQGDKTNPTYFVQVYNLTLLCSEEYVIEPQSVSFLVQHGFDFNKQYAQGIPYNKGNDKGTDAHAMNVRSLFVEVLRARKPLVVHNGLVDMVFLYQCFYAHLPERLGTFTADLSEMFPAGIYDTKYATEYELRLVASYLEYAFKKCKLDNSRSIEGGGKGPHMSLEFCNYTGNMKTYVDYRPCPDSQGATATTDVCIQFSAYGWCPNGSQCPMSHDTDLIILQDEKGKETKSQKRKRRKAQKGAMEHDQDAQDAPPSKQAHTESSHMDVGGQDNGTDKNVLTVAKTTEDPQEGACSHAGSTNNETAGAAGEDGVPVTSEGQVADLALHPVSDAKRAADVKKAESGLHRAGFDAFMTGYIFAYGSALAVKPEEPSPETWLPSCLNKLYLSGKSVPLQVVKSTFSKSSKAHMHKMDNVWGKHQNQDATPKTENVA